MQIGLKLLNELETEDINWIMENANEQQVIANTRLIEEGGFPDSLYFVLEGMVGVFVSSLEHKLITSLGPGEVFGEMSFLADVPASATVQAVENSLLLAMPHRELKSRMELHPDFAARLYRALALMAHDRMRNNVDTMGRIWSQKAAAEDHDNQTWAFVENQMQKFKALMQEADREALKNDNIVPDELAEQIVSGFREFSVFMNEKLGDESEENPYIKDELGARIQREMLPYILLSGIAERIYAKPRGYAGDFMTIELLYENDPKGTSRLGPLLDRCFLKEPAAIAVRNRRGLLKEEIKKVLEKSQGTVRVTSLASGPAAELFDVFEQLEDTTRLKTTLVDIDLQALAFVGDKRDKLRLTRQMEMFNGNLVYLATGRQKMDTRPQDLVYSIGLIDYFSDKFVIMLLNYVHDLLKPGGKVILGNFHPRNTSKALMDHVIDWKLIHRTEEDMNRLFESSTFGKPCTEIRYEEQGVNLFASCVK
ncbi:MAG: cyclic nucleotide-binding domain-containing protein [Acidobacteriota bacterium]|nr:cyclic nucleotide-binding domain-containing protein [Acidobacteriota bacterium]